MTIAAEVLNFPDVRPLPGVDRAWTFPAARNRFQRAIALASNDGYAFQVACSNGFSDEAAGAVLHFTRRHEAALFNATPFGVATGFRLPGRGFDCVASALPAATDSHTLDWEQRVFDVFPAWACEFSGDESEAEAKARFTGKLDPMNYRREVQPFVRMRYENPRSGLRASKAGHRMLADAARLDREIRVADQVGDGWVEAENFRGQVRRVEWHGGTAELVDPGTEDRTRFTVGDTVEFVRRFLTEGMNLRHDAQEVRRNGNRASRMGRCRCLS
ncbi:hypothetical protein L0U85_09350 [Glycomyces sp. L485]|uniref:hypothetical protein n=1 Tax=Glycomyces sp. L485 TaxID=2909235 RepID=UPI001F4B2A83|nr:hypothetical protein [Glycomyces sp. L485]MCH7231055.1 hypothetical protein [Glycomyces sp. L485]